MFPDLEFIKTCLNGLRSRIEKVENGLRSRIEQVEDWIISFRTNRPNWAQNDPEALDYVKGRTHYEANGKVVQLPPKFLPSPTSYTVGAIKADAVKTTDIQPVRLGTDGKLYSSGVPIFTTSGTGSAYTANVPEITELVDGMLVVMIPHVASTSASPTLNINGLGAYSIRRFISGSSGGNVNGYNSGWLSPGVPVLLMYSSSRWAACNFTRPSAADLTGAVPVSQGGTGRLSLTEGAYLIGNGTNPVMLKTPSEVLADIGAIPAPAAAKVGQAIVVKAVDENGKPTEWETADIESGGASSGAWELVSDVALEEDTNTISFTDLNASELRFSFLGRFNSADDSMSNANQNVTVSINGVTYVALTVTQFGYVRPSGTNFLTLGEVRIVGGYAQAIISPHGGTNTATTTFSGRDIPATNISQIKFYTGVDTTLFKSGGRFILYKKA